MVNGDGLGAAERTAGDEERKTLEKRYFAGCVPMVLVSILKYEAVSNFHMRRWFAGVKVTLWFLTPAGFGLG